jgi:hypothetical protein
MREIEQMIDTPHCIINWEQTISCMDFYCSQCKKSSHSDLENMSRVTCEHCETDYALGNRIDLSELVLSEPERNNYLLGLLPICTPRNTFQLEEGEFDPSSVPIVQGPIVENFDIRHRYKEQIEKDLSVASLQWKGTAATMTLYCKCGQCSIIDEINFAYYILCCYCDTIYETHSVVTLSEIPF